MHASSLCAPNLHVTKKVLKNGMICLAHSRPKTGMIALNIRINTGSASETKFLGSGISHLAEHMAFKATQNYTVGKIEEKIKSLGGKTNASTSYDSTSFFILAPKEHFTEIARILKEMIFFPVASKKEFDDEKSVILKELILYHDKPDSKISELLFETAYLTHPYRYPIIGYEELFSNITYTDLCEYRKTHYIPNNMVISVVGDMPEQNAIAILDKVFSDIPMSKYPNVVQPNERHQITSRQNRQKDDISLAYISYGYHSIPLLDDDLFALDLLASILGRGDGSRLYKKVVKEKSLAHSISAFNYTPKAMGLFGIDAVLDPVNIQQVNKLIIAEIEKMKNTPISSKELRKVKNLIISDYIFEQEDLVSIAANLTRDEMFTGNFNFSNTYIEQIEKITPKDIQQVAKKYLNPETKNYVELLPENFKIPEQETSDNLIFPTKEKVVKKTLKNGIKILAVKNNQTKTAVITISVAAGLRAENKKNNGISRITGLMLLKGTENRDESEIKEAFEQLGGNISVSSGKNTIVLTAQILQSDLQFAIELLADIIKNPNFPKEQFAKIKQLALYDIQSENDDIFQQAKKTLRKELFQKPPYSLTETGTTASVDSLKLSDIIKFYSDYFIANTMTISVCGNIDPVDTIAAIATEFSDISETKNTILSPISVTNLSQNKTVHIDMPKEETIVILGFPGITISNPEHFEFEILTSVLSGMGGRLFQEIRNNLGLSYTQGFFSRPEYDTGSFGFFVATSHENATKVITALNSEIEKLLKYGITEEELNHAKISLITNNRLTRLHNKSIASSMAINETLRLSYSDIFDYEENIKKITLSDIKHLINKYFRQNHITITVGQKTK